MLDVINDWIAENKMYLIAAGGALVGLVVATIVVAVLCAKAFLGGEGWGVAGHLVHVN